MGVFETLRACIGGGFCAVLAGLGGVWETAPRFCERERVDKRIKMIWLPGFAIVGKNGGLIGPDVLLLMIGFTCVHVLS